MNETRRPKRTDTALVRVRQTPNKLQMMSTMECQATLVPQSDSSSRVNYQGVVSADVPPIGNGFWQNLENNGTGKQQCLGGFLSLSEVIPPDYRVSLRVYIFKKCS